jgi:hypothetical protein
MLYPLLGARIHGWLDDLVVLTYLAGAFALSLSGVALATALGGAAVHFLLARLTDYPQGTWRQLSFRTHAFVELGEGLLVLASTALLAGDAPWQARAFLAALGVSQLVAFSFSDYRWPEEARPRG